MVPVLKQIVSLAENKNKKASLPDQTNKITLKQAVILCDNVSLKNTWKSTELMKLWQNAPTSGYGWSEGRKKALA